MSNSSFSINKFIAVLFLIKFLSQIVWNRIDLHYNFRNAKTPSLLPGGLRNKTGTGVLHHTSSTSSVDSLQTVSESVVCGAYTVED